MRAMILAAGRGERMRPLTDTRPKPLLEVGGKPLIQYHLEALARAGITEIVINLAWQGELIRRALGGGERFGAHIRYSEEPEGALETGGGIFAALPLLGSEPFLLISGDIWTEFPLAACIDRLGRDDVAHFEFFAGQQPGRFALAPLMFEWIRQDRVSGELYRGRWHNLGTPAQLAHLDAQLRAPDSSSG